MAERKNVNNGDWDAKGDLLVGTANDAFDQLAVGTNGKALVALASATPGMEWAQTAYAAGLLYKTNGYYGVPNYGVNSAITPAFQRLYCQPYFVRRTHTFDRIGVFQNANGTATAVMRLGIYSDDGAGYPGALLLDAGTYDAASGGAVFKQITISQEIPYGVCWLACVSQVAASGAVNAGPATNVGNPYGYATTAFGQFSAFYQDTVTGALPANFTTTANSVGQCPNMWLRAT